MGTTRVILEKDLIGGSTLEHVYPITSDLAVYNTHSVNIANYTAIINVNAFRKKLTAYTTKQSARTDIGNEYRHSGIVLTYNLNGTWVSEQFIANSLLVDWTDDQYWQPFGSGGSGTVGTLDTTSTSSLTPGTESFEDNLSLHRISKTGLNTDLNDYVGMVRYDNGVRQGGIVFNDYENNNATGMNSVAFGSHTKASGNNQIILGKYNVEDVSNKYVLIIGNGSSTTSYDILNVDWSGNIWGNTDVMCGGTFSNPQYRLSDLDNKLNTVDLDDTFRETKVYLDIIDTIIGSKYAYSFDTLEEMVTDNTKGLLYVDSDEYKQGGQLLMQQLGVSDYWITTIKDSFESYTWVDDETFEADVETAGMLQVGYYVITKLETGSIDLTQYVKKSKLKTVNNIALFDDDAPDGEAGDIPFPTVTDTVESGNTNAVSSDGVYSYITENTLSSSALKILNTTNTTSQTTSASESLYTVDGIINLHRISKTGVNTDLIDYIGKRVIVNNSDTHSEIFNDYTTNQCTGYYSHIEGGNNNCYGDYSHISGRFNTVQHNYCNVSGYGNTTNADYQTIIGKFCTPLQGYMFIVGNGISPAEGQTRNIFTINTGGGIWSEYIMSIGTMDPITGIPNIPNNAFSNNDLVTKYYVDSKITTSLFEGVVDTNSSLLIGDAEGSTAIVKSNICNWIDEDNNVQSQNAVNILNVKIGTKWYGQYDILSFTDDTSLINNVNVLGGTKSISDSSNYNTPVYLHKIAQTGSYNDLTDTPDLSEYENTANKVTIITALSTDTEYPSAKAVYDLIVSSIYTNVTYDDLVTLISNNGLIPGTYYRITDYVTTTTQSNTNSAGHQFDLIVLATSSNTLDCRAMAVNHNGDTYFSSNNADLSKWQIWYDVNNDTSKYAWADAVNGKGVIYRMIDEQNNDCPYDFKNIRFKVGANAIAGTVDNVYYYTFSIAQGTNDNTVTDNSFNKYVCYGNTLKRYINGDKISLNFNVFRNTLIENHCFANIFENNCYFNTFGSECYANIFKIYFHHNTFGNYCYRNKFGDYCYENTFGNYCYNNDFGDAFYNNTFGQNGYGNKFESYCCYNTFGDFCYYNIFGHYCYNNTFGNYCSFNTFGNYCSYNDFGNSSNQYGNYCSYNILENGCQYIRLYNTSTAAHNRILQNITICQGVSGTYSNRLEINTIVRNLSYQTKVAKNSAGVLKIYCEADLIQ